MTFVVVAFISLAFQFRKKGKHNALEIENCDFSTQYSTSNCFFSITFKNKTTHFVQPKNSYSVQTAKIPLHDLAIFAGWAHAIFGARVPA